MEGTACRSDDPSVQLPREESRELLARLVEDAVADESAVYVHEWEVGDTMVWDNRRLLHRAFPYDYAEPRVLMSTRVEGGEDCAADNVSGSFAGELSVAPSPELPFGQCGRQVLEEELACQRQEVAEGVPRMLAATTKHGRQCTRFIPMGITCYMRSRQKAHALSAEIGRAARHRRSQRSRPA